MARLRFVQNVSLWHIKNGISSSNISRYFRISLQLNFGTPSKSEHVLAAGPNIKLTGHWQLNSLKGKRKTNFQEDKTSLQLGKSFKIPTSWHLQQKHSARLSRTQNPEIIMEKSRSWPETCFCPRSTWHSPRSSTLTCMFSWELETYLHSYSLQSYHVAVKKYSIWQLLNFPCQVHCLKSQKPSQNFHFVWNEPASTRVLTKKIFIAFYHTSWITTAMRRSYLFPHIRAFKLIIWIWEWTRGETWNPESNPRRALSGFRLCKSWKLCRKSNALDLTRININ